MTFFARQTQALQRAAHGGYADPHAGLGRDPGAQLLQRRIGMLAYQALEDGLSGRVQAGVLAARVGLRGNTARGTVLAQHFLHKPETHAEHVGLYCVGSRSAAPRRGESSDVNQSSTQPCSQGYTKAVLRSSANRSRFSNNSNQRPLSHAR